MLQLKTAIRTRIPIKVNDSFDLSKLHIIKADFQPFPFSGIFRVGGNSFVCERKFRSEIE